MSQPARAQTLRRLRLFTLTLGGLLLLWLPVEDESEHWVILLAAAICSLFAARLLVTPLPRSWLGWLPRNEWPHWLAYPGLAALAGLGITPVALFLMAFKSGVHGHSRPDFTPDQLASVIARTPLWVAAGLLVGLGIALYKKK